MTTSKTPSPAAKSRRGRPSASRVGAIDRTIIETARQLFLADGFDAVAMEQVAAVAKVSKGTLYARYPAKEALFTAVIRASLREWSEEAARQDHELTDDITLDFLTFWLRPRSIPRKRSVSFFTAR